jgi:hypothetical protein
VLPRQQSPSFGNVPAWNRNQGHAGAWHTASML